MIRTLAQGGMGSVELARARDGSLVVLKRPHEHDEDSIARLRDEARVGARLNHPSIVETLDLFEDENGPCLVVNYIDGISLEQLRKKGPQPTSLVARVGRQIAEGLSELHTASDEMGQPLNVLHRDVSPGNIVVDKSGNAHLIDLGIARFDERQADKTQDGFLRGTMRYLAPELIKGESYSTASDLWSLGLVLWEAALGRFVWPGDSDREIVAAILDGKPLTHFGSHLPESFRAAIAPLVEPEPNVRCRNAAAAAGLFRALEATFGDTQDAARRQINTILGVALDDHEMTESIVKAPPPVDDFGDPTEVLGQEVDDAAFGPRPVSFVGAHPYPELAGPPPTAIDEEDVEQSDLEAKVRAAQESLSLLEMDVLDDDIVEIPREVTMIGRAPERPPAPAPVSAIGDPIELREEPTVDLGAAAAVDVEKVADYFDDGFGDVSLDGFKEPSDPGLRPDAADEFVEVDLTSMTGMPVPEVGIELSDFGPVVEDPEDPPSVDDSVEEFPANPFLSPYVPPVDEDATAVHEVQLESLASSDPLADQTIEVQAIDIEAVEERSAESHEVIALDDDDGFTPTRVTRTDTSYISVGPPAAGDAPIVAEEPNRLKTPELGQIGLRRVLRKDGQDVAVPKVVSVPRTPNSDEAAATRVGLAHLRDEDLANPPERLDNASFLPSAVSAPRAQAPVSNAAVDLAPPVVQPPVSAPEPPNPDVSVRKLSLDDVLDLMDD